MAKERILLSDLTLHTRGFRQTGNFAKVGEKGRMYSHLPDGAAKNVDQATHTARFVIELPQDLKERLARGEVELVMPEGGTPVYPGRDVIETLKQMYAKARRALIHRSRGKDWHAESDSV